MYLFFMIKIVANQDELTWNRALRDSESMIEFQWHWSDNQGGKTLAIILVQICILQLKLTHERFLYNCDIYDRSLKLEQHGLRISNILFPNWRIGFFLLT